MGVLADRQIREQIKITPYSRAKKRKNKISWGESSYGYDLRLGDNYRIFSNVNNVVVDPKKFNANSFVVHKGPHCIIPPNSFVLAESYETLEIPRDIQTICVGKSTYARCGIIVNVTPLEPCWIGKVTIEISNSTPLPVKVYSFEGILQVIFFRADGAYQAPVDLILETLRPMVTSEYYDLLREEAISKLKHNALCQISYADKTGKYQNQKGLTLPKVDGK